jgi:hypothetical protein
MLGGRPLSLILSEVHQPSNYAAVWQMAGVYPRFRENFGRYFLGRGSYPYDCQVRTPRGLVSVRLESSHDMLTVNEIFCREDYRVGSDLRTVVDIGSNIGASALYFLTRYVLREQAVADFSGTTEFGIEAFGRYGGIGRETGQKIEVECVHINHVLAEVLDTEELIDVLKIDTEGYELATVQAIAKSHLERIRVIYFEIERDPGPIHADLFDRRFRNQTCQLSNRRRASGLPMGRGRGRFRVPRPEAELEAPARGR